MTGFDITLRLMAIASRQDELMSVIARCQLELQALEVEKCELDIQQQQIAADVSEKNIRNSLAYKAEFLREVLDL